MIENFTTDARIPQNIVDLLSRTISGIIRKFTDHCRNKIQKVGDRLIFCYESDASLYNTFGKIIFCGVRSKDVWGQGLA